ncbi:hypothetical protein SELMODRAFT_77083 [Selaginella moellendorffii]|uniref:SUI1 domain-containing protein n=1 Tax=Selaginella moellendorffii TaxID=88036 RepID=D8QTI8_SELML|nr:hypothetical protein SELMODRAFT_77083 [Selaginella moellendorffii]
MFKKASEVKAQQRLSGADRKKLRRSICERFGHATDAHIESILPAKADVTVAKLANPNRLHVYVVDGGPPMLFDVDGEVFPTVYALWKLPSLLPAFILKGAEVSRYVVGGADLMFPGITIPPEGLPEFEAGQPWVVKVPGNDFPIAVGTTAMSSTAAKKAGYRGKALRILHFYPDTLWSSAEGRYVPNAGFSEGMISEDPSTSQQAGDGEGSAQGVDEQDQEHEQEQEQGGANSGDDGTEIYQVTEPEYVAVDVKDLKLAPDTSAAEEADEECSSIEVGSSTGVSTEEMDLLLDRCLLQALHTTVKDKDLPIPASILWSGHILPARPAGSTVDIKKSSHKKLSKWLQTKSASGLVVAKESKPRKEIMLCSVNRSHALYQEFKPEKKVATSEHTTPDSKSANESVQSPFEAVEVWKPTHHVAPILNAVGADASKFYTAAEASEVVFSYVDKESLVKPDNKAVVALDAVLCDALFKGAVKKGSSYPSEVLKRDLGATFLGRMQAHHKVTRDGKSVVRKGALRCAQIITERRQGNKKVTRVSGLESFLVDPDALAAELQKKFACSTSLAEVPGKFKGEKEILVQGGVIENLGKHLVQQYGIPKKFIEILDKTKK